MPGYFLAALSCGLLLSQAQPQNLTPRDLPPVTVVEAQPVQSTATVGGQAADQANVPVVPAPEPVGVEEPEEASPAAVIQGVAETPSAPAPAETQKPVAAFWVIVPGK